MAKHLRQSGTAPASGEQGASRPASESGGRRAPRFTPPADGQTSPRYDSSADGERSSGRRTPRFTPESEDRSPSQPAPSSGRRRAPRFKPETVTPQSTELPAASEERHAPRSTPATDIESSPRQTPGPAATMVSAQPMRYSTTGHEPRTWWGVLIFVLALAAVLGALGWFFVLPNLDLDLGFGLGGEEAQPIYDEQTSQFLAQDGTQWNLSSDLRSPVELEGVSDDGVAVRFQPLPGFEYVTVHVVSCELNGDAHDPSRDDDAVSYTVVNESTGESVETIDPFFIASGSGDGSEGTIVVVKGDGLDAAEYDSLVLGIDQQLSQDSASEEDASDINGLEVSVTKAN